MNTTSLQDVLITGMGIVSPIGNSCQEVWQSIEAQQSGVRSIPQLAEYGWIAPFAGAVTNFEAKEFVKPRKSMKVMCREMQLAAGASEMAWQHAGLDETDIDPERAGIVAAAAGHQFCPVDELEDSYLAWMQEQPEFDVNCMPAVVRDHLYPLWMLKYLPNLNACHIGIRRSFYAHTNTVSISETSSLLAIAEATDVIRRGTADVMFTGGVGSNLHAMRLIFHCGARVSRDGAVPERACRPFDKHRSGMVYGEGAAFFVLESRAHAQRRGARPLARVAATARRCEGASATRLPTGDAVRWAIEGALAAADVHPDEIGHVNAHGNSTIEDDPIEAQAIRQTLGDVPVTAPKSFFGNLNAGTGAVELAVSLIAAEHGVVPPSLNYETPDEACPVNVVCDPLPTQRPTFMALNHACSGQAIAVILTSPD